MVITRSLILLVCAVAAAVVFTIMAFNIWVYDYPFGVLGLAVALGLASRVP